MGGHSIAPSTESPVKMKGKSMFGVQELSSRRSSPAHGFGSGTRFGNNKVYLGPEHAKTSSISTTPGPHYETTSAVGYQADSGKLSQASWRFGTQERFGEMRSARRSMSPGPGAYDNASAMGKQGLSHRSSFPLYGFGTVDRAMASKVFISPAHAASTYGQASPGPAAMYSKPGGFHGPKYGFGTDDRFQLQARQLSDESERPGPGAYSLETTLGSTQRSSRVTAQPAFGFGSSNRSHSERVFISALHAKSTASSVVSPGPSVYTPASSIGRQATSRGHSAPTWGFGKASRFDAKTYMTDTPGPGSYAI